MQSTINSVSKPIGVIDSLQGGFNLVTRRPWLLLLPVLVDLILWRGPKLLDDAIDSARPGDDLQPA